MRDWAAERHEAKFKECGKHITGAAFVIAGAHWEALFTAVNSSLRR
jgi:hypothetical protein